MDCCLTNTDAHVTGGSEDGSVFFWDLVDASVVSSFRAHSSVVNFLSVISHCIIVIIKITPSFSLESELETVRLILVWWSSSIIDNQDKLYLA